jgi:hypothetical protein
MVACETGHEQNSRMTEGVGGRPTSIDLMEDDRRLLLLISFNTRSNGKRVAMTRSIGVGMGLGGDDSRMEDCGSG